MKKLSALVLAALTVSMSSCLKSDNDNDSYLVSPGLTIYSLIYNQNVITNTPAMEVLDFNMLLSDFDPEKHETLDDVKVGDIKVKNALFGSYVKISEMEDYPGKYEIVYEYDGYNVGNDGIIEINTSGKTLDELQMGESWTVILNKNKENAFCIGGIRVPRYEIVGSYIITPVEPGKVWSLIIPSSHVTYYKTEIDQGWEPSTWNLNYKIKLKEGESLAYSDLKDGALSVTGSGNGTVFFGNDMVYKISEEEPMILYPGKNRNPTAFSGTAFYEFADKFQVDPSEFPSLKTTVWYEKTEYGRNQYIEYNGTTKQFYF